MGGVGQGSMAANREQMSLPAPPESDGMQMLGDLTRGKEDVA